MRFILILLAACGPMTTPSKDGTIHDTADTGHVDSGPILGDDTAAPMPTYDITSGALVYALPWLAGLAPFAGYAGAGADGGFYVADPVGDGVNAFVHRLPWTATSAATVEDAAEVTLSAGLYGPDKLSYTGGLLSIPDADADVGDVASAGIAYLLPEPDAGGSLADAATYTFQGAYTVGYTGRAIWLDADGDGYDDDVVVTATADVRGVSNGALAVYLDAAPGSHTWADADAELVACYDHDETHIKYGPVDLALDAGGDVLYVACPAADYAEGSVELWSLPLVGESGVSEPFAYLYGVGGWTITADPRGGAWAGSQGNGAVAYTSADARTAFGAYPEAMGDTVQEGFGATPAIMQTSTGQILMAVGQQTRDPADTGSGSAIRVAPLSLPPTFDAGPPSPPDGSSTDSTGSLWLCDVTDMPVPSDVTHYAHLDCAEYERPKDSAVACAGGVQGIHEADGVLTVATAGWVYGTGDGCGVSAWAVSLP
jgi:hypothetical protein